MDHEEESGVEVSAAKAWKCGACGSRTLDRGKSAPTCCGVRMKADTAYMAQERAARSRLTVVLPIRTEGLQ